MSVASHQIDPPAESRDFLRAMDDAYTAGKQIEDVLGRMCEEDGSAIGYAKARGETLIGWPHRPTVDVTIPFLGIDADDWRESLADRLTELAKAIRGVVAGRRA